MKNKVDNEADKKNYFSDKLIGNENRLNQLEIELRSFLKNITLTKWFVIIILGLLGFFGYREVIGIRKTVVNSIKPQIRYVDSLVTSIKTAKLDSLFKLIKERESEQKKLLRKMDDIISSSKELENKYIRIMSEDLPYRVNETIQEGYTPQEVHNYFDIVKPINNKFTAGNFKRIVVVKLKISVSSVHHICVRIFRGDTILGEINYLPKESYNKLTFQRNLTSKMYVDVGIFLKSEWNAKYPPFYYRRIWITE